MANEKMDMILREKLKPFVLDKEWIFDGTVWCAFCGKKGLWYDESNGMDATHYCPKCNQGLVLIGSCRLREAN